MSVLSGLPGRLVLPSRSAAPAASGAGKSVPQGMVTSMSCRSLAAPVACRTRVATHFAESPSLAVGLRSSAHAMKPSLRRRAAVITRASDESGGASAKPVEAEPVEKKDKIGNTLDTLNALLGIDEEEEKRKEQEAEERQERAREAKEASKASAATSAAPGLLDKVLEADKERSKNKSTFDKLGETLGDKDDAEKDKDGKPENVEGEERLRKELDNLVEVLRLEGGIEKEDIKAMKDKVFGPGTFWITDVRPNEGLEGGSFFKGNFRSQDKAQVFDECYGKLKAEFGDKYELFMVEDPEAFDMDDARPEPRISFLVMQSYLATPPAIGGWQIAVAFILASLSFFSALQLGLVSGVSKLPPEILEFFANPSNLDAGLLPPGLENFEVTDYIASVLPVTWAIIAVAATHEAGHQIAGLSKGVKMGIPFFIPNAEIGSFGAITQFRSLVRDRTTMFDIAAAGPAAGMSVAAGIFVYGLAQSVGGDPDALLAIPSQLFQGSLLLGGMVRAVLGEAAMGGKEVLVHPMVVAGWCAMTTQAFSLLPVGSLDGGRITQNAFGRGALAITSLFTYVGLGLGLLGSSLALPFGLLVLLTQRVQERNVLNTITPVDSKRAYITAALLCLSLFILLPMAPDVADSGLDGAPFL